MIITYPQIDKLKRRIDNACGLLQKALADGRINAYVNQELHKQALCYAGLVKDIDLGHADTDNADIQTMFSAASEFCTLVETNLNNSEAA